MKRVTLLTAILSVIAISVNSQTESKEIRTVKYGIEVNHFNLGSGFGGGSELQFQLKSVKNRTIGLGLYVDNQSQKLVGITFNHKRMLFSGNRTKERFFQPYVLYNFIYRLTTIPEVTANLDKTGDIVTYTSMEHHIGIGIKTNVSKIFYINSEIGYGLYLGSIKRPSAPDPITNEITGTSGFGKIAKIGFGFTF